MQRHLEKVNAEKIMLLTTRTIFLTAMASLLASVTLSCGTNDVPDEPHRPKELRGVGEHAVIERIIEPKVTPVLAKETEIITEPAPISLGTFKLTAYCPCPQCCGQWADGITFTGTTATAGRTIAVDPNVIPLGSTVYINGQAYIAEDIGGAIKGNRIDVFFPAHDEALQFGVQYAEVAIEK